MQNTPATTSTHSSSLQFRLMMLAAGVMGFLWIASGCSSNDASPAILLNQTPSILHLVSGNGQIGAAGTQLAMPIVFLVTDQSNNPITATPVLFRLTSGQATLTPSSLNTDANGMVDLFVTLGASGTINGTAITAGLVTQPVPFTATSR